MDISHVSTAPRVAAPDGSEVTVLAATPRGSMARFRLEPGQTAAPVAHHSVDEVWFVAAGYGEIWRRDLDGAERVDRLEPGVSLAIEAGVAFQFRCTGDGRLDVIGVTMPPWPGADEAEPADGIWPPTSGG